MTVLALSDRPDVELITTTFENAMRKRRIVILNSITAFDILVEGFPWRVSSQSNARSGLQDTRRVFI